jgi:methylated-DNA-protein-cysteine methyltransferase-like protein
MSSNSLKVFKALQSIPVGKVTKYMMLAKHVGIKSPRVIGNILHKNEDSNLYPCHRVVRSDGKIASGYAMGGPNEQMRRLRQEGVQFVSTYKVDLSTSLYSFS